MSLRHHSLVAWQRADDLFITLHQLAPQARLHFLNIAEGSLAEVGYCLHAALGGFVGGVTVLLLLERWTS